MHLFVVRTGSLPPLKVRNEKLEKCRSTPSGYNFLDRFNLIYSLEWRQIPTGSKFCGSHLLRKNDCGIFFQLGHRTKSEPCLELQPSEQSESVLVDITGILLTVNKAETDRQTSKQASKHTNTGNKTNHCKRIWAGTDNHWNLRRRATTRATCM